MKDVGSAVLAGSSPPFLGRERAAVETKARREYGEASRERKVGFIENTAMRHRAVGEGK